MQRAAVRTTATLDVTELVNSAWSANYEAALAGEEFPASTSLLLSDVIRLDGRARSQTGFDAITFVMHEALAHTERYCREQSVRIRAFRSVEVLRFMLPGDAISFLFLFEPIHC